MFCEISLVKMWVRILILKRTRRFTKIEYLGSSEDLGISKLQDDLKFQVFWIPRLTFRFFSKSLFMFVQCYTYCILLMSSKHRDATRVEIAETSAKSFGESPC